MTARGVTPDIVFVGFLILIFDFMEGEMF